MMAFFLNIFLLTFLFVLIDCSCDAPAPAFPLPNLDTHAQAQNLTSQRIISAIKKIVSQPEYDATSFSVEITSSRQSLFSLQHTARQRSSLFGGGAERVDNSTRYRIASMTKPFTVLALLQLQKAGKLNLDDPVLGILPGLAKDQSGSLPWKDITLRALMSQQSGIPRDFAQDDLINEPAFSEIMGLPKIDRKSLDLPTCDQMVNYTRMCNETEFFDYIKTLEPIFAPNQHSTYSNINFDLLGLVIANISGMPYEDYITTHILEDLGMNHTTFEQPPDSVAAIAKDVEYYWPLNLGVQNPTGGLYSSSNDMSIWLRYVLSTYNAQTPALNWLTPTSWGGSIQSFYGAPWEINRARLKDIVPQDSGLVSTRPVTFITKGGGLPGYTSMVVILPEYGLGITFLEAGTGQLLSNVREIVTREMIGFAERIALDGLGKTYGGTYEDQKTNSTVVLAQSAEHGLFVQEWISNGTDSLTGLHSVYMRGSDKLTLSVVPTLLFVDEKNQKGQRWRILPSAEWSKDDANPGRTGIWSNFCVGDWDFLQYGGKPLNEIIFWLDDVDDRVIEVELPAFRSKLSRASGDAQVQGAPGEERLVDQSRWRL